MRRATIVIDSTHNVLKMFLLYRYTRIDADINKGNGIERADTKEVLNMERGR